MKIALMGYGKMGKAVEEAALKRGHHIVLRITTANLAELTPDSLALADVAIEFSRPESAFGNVAQCLMAHLPVASGTTGWNDQLPAAKDLAYNLNGSFIHASNFSVGVNILFSINEILAKYMNLQDDYRVVVEETHHIHKKDAPSGTAITLAEGILRQISRLDGWQLNGEGAANSLPVKAHRIDDVPGTHSIKYTSAIDNIEIIHTARNREGFALGAVLAAEFIQNRRGVFTMKDVLGIE